MGSMKLDAATQAYLDRQRAWCEGFTRRLVHDGIIRDTDTALFTRSLAQILAQPFNRRRAPLETLSALPSVPPIDPGAASVIARGHEIIGEAHLTASYDTEISRVEVVGHEHALTVYGVALKWFLGYQQIRQSAFAGVPLESLKRNAVARVIAEHIDQTLAYGNLSAGLTGAWTNAAVARWQGGVFPATITGNWALAATTDAQIISDVDQMYQWIRGNFKLYAPNKLAVGPAEYARLIQPMTLISYGGTLKDHIQRSWGLEVFELSRLAVIPAVYRAVGLIGPRAVMYEGSEEVFYPYVTAGPEEFPPVQTDTGYSVTMHQRTGGVECTNPLGAVYLDMA